MAWSINERFPSWGEAGEFPPAGFFYEGGDQVNEKHLDALWNGVGGIEEDVIAALDDIDGDSDGVVDAADTAALVKGNDIDSDGDGTVNAADTATLVKGNDIDSNGDGKVDAADNSDLLEGNDTVTIRNHAPNNHGNEAHDTNFTTLTEVNNNADVPNADFADQAGDADTLDGNDAGDFATASDLSYQFVDSYTDTDETTTFSQTFNVSGYDQYLVQVFLESDSEFARPYLRINNNSTQEYNTQFSAGGGSDGNATNISLGRGSFTICGCGSIKITQRDTVDGFGSAVFEADLHAEEAQYSTDTAVLNGTSGDEVNSISSITVASGGDSVAGIVEVYGFNP